MFSPYYAWAGRRAPEDHCAINVALYGAGGHRWAMTERGRSKLSRSADALAVAGSAMRWEGSHLRIDIDEWTVPIPERMRGTVRVWPEAIQPTTFRLAEDGRHDWRPIAPVARVEVDLPQPGRRWVGHGYFDCNSGDAPLERGFQSWHWSRAPIGQDAAVLYDMHRRDGSESLLALRIDRTGRAEAFEPPPLASLTRSAWGVARATRSAGEARVARTWEDTPFYARSSVEGRLFGERVSMMHESLDLDRFAAPWVRVLLPFRMPRIAG